MWRRAWLAEGARSPGSVAFIALDGGVSAGASDGRTEVTILSREYDSWAERFIREPA